MTATAGFVGLNTQLKVATAASPTGFTLVGECQDITLNGETVEFAEFTHQQSTSGYREYKPTFKNGGDISTTFNWTTDAGQLALKTGYDADAILYFQVTYPNAKIHTFTGYVSSLGVSAPMGGALRKNLTVRTTGAITEA